jgi:hypothetical protein
LKRVLAPKLDTKDSIVQGFAGRSLDTARESRFGFITLPMLGRLERFAVTEMKQSMPAAHGFPYHGTKVSCSSLYRWHLLAPVSPGFQTARKYCAQPKPVRGVRTAMARTHGR